MVRRWIPLVAAILALACGTTGPVSSPSPSYVVDIDPSLHTRLTASDVAEIALKQIDLMARGAAAAGSPITEARILTVSARGAANIREVESQFAVDSTATGVLWVVRAEGTFTTNRPLGPQRYWGSGYFVIDDATGDIMGDGMP